MSVALDIALYTALTGDTGTGGVNHASAGATGGFHQGVAPQTAGFPRVHFMELLTTPLYTFRQAAVDHVFYQIDAYAKDSTYEGVTKAGNLSERIRVLLTDNSFSVSGGSLLYCRFDRSVPPTFEQDGVNGGFIYRKGGIYELWLAPT